MEPIPFDAFTRLVLAEYEPPMKAPKTRQRMAQVLRTVAALPGVTTTADLRRPAVAAFIQARGPDANPNTTIGMLGYFRAACTYAVDEAYLDRSPFESKGVGKWIRAGAPARVTHHAPREVARVLDRLKARATDWEGRRLHALGCLVALAGLRRDEALFLQREDLDLQTQVALVSPRRRLKTVRSAAPVPLCDELAAVLRRWLPDAGEVWVFPGKKGVGAWSGGSPGYRPLDRLKAVAEDAGVTGLTFQSLRHSCASLLEALGVPELVIQRVLRHTNARTTARYRHADVVALVDWVRGVSYGRAA